MKKWILLGLHEICMFLLIFQEVKLCFPNWFILVILSCMAIIPAVIVVIKERGNWN